MKTTLRSLLLLCILTAASAFSAPANAKPNILFILADDMGWADAGCYGADLHETPNIDRLARESVRFTDAYAMSVCSPTRATIMTGKHAARLHFTIWAEGAEEGGPKKRKLRDAAAIWNLPHSETTIAKHLHDAGYLTALIGKWHLGDWQHYPETHGFDINIGGTNWGAPATFFWPYSGTGRYGKEYRYIPHLEYGHPGEYLTDRLTDEAIKVMDHTGDKPFFIYLAHHAIHTPMEAKADDVKYFEGKLAPGLNHQNAVYAGMTKSLDESVGRMLAHLKERGLDKNTIVVFASDNGGYTGIDRQAGQKIPVTNNTPLRSGKGSLYEGGVRVPLIVRWPGVTTAATESHEPVMLMDLFPTLLTAAGIPLPDGVPCDATDLAPLLKHPDSHLARDAVFFHYPHYYETTTPVSAVRMGDWKLLEYFEDNHTELYNLKDDLGEKTDLAQQQPGKAAELLARLHAWREEVGAALPTPNPDFKGKPGKAPAKEPLHNDEGGRGPKTRQ